MTILKSPSDGMAANHPSEDFSPSGDFSPLGELYRAVAAATTRSASHQSYRELLECIAEMAASAIRGTTAIVCSYDATVERLRVEAVAGPEDVDPGNSPRDTMGAVCALAEAAKQALRENAEFSWIVGEPTLLPFVLSERSIDGDDLGTLLGAASSCSVPFFEAGMLSGTITIVPSPGPSIREGTIRTLATHASVFVERWRHTSLLHDIDARFRNIAESEKTFFVQLEAVPAKRFTYVGESARKITGYSPDEFLANPDLYVKIIHPDDFPLAASAPQSTSQPPRVRYRAFRKDGRPVWLEHRFVWIRDSEGVPIAAEGIVEDVTDQVEVEERILKAERLEAAGRVSAQIAHDFANLLTPLMWYAEQSLETLPENSPASKAASESLEIIRLMVDINNNLMGLGRRGNTDVVSVDINQLASSIEHRQYDLPPNIVLTLRLDPDLYKVGGSPSQIMRVISNLTNNAIESMPDGGTLTIETANVAGAEVPGNRGVQADERWVCLRVTDTGCGIAPTIRRHVFDAFFTTKRGSTIAGSGLGLSVVQAIVDDHNGTVSFESQVGVGSSFHVYLPAEDNPSGSPLSPLEQ